jgi:hypothetical protein
VYIVKRRQHRQLKNKKGFASLLILHMTLTMATNVAPHCAARVFLELPASMRLSASASQLHQVLTMVLVCILLLFKINLFALLFLFHSVFFIRNTLRIVVTYDLSK